MDYKQQIGEIVMRLLLFILVGTLLIAGPCMSAAHSEMVDVVPVNAPLQTAGGVVMTRAGTDSECKALGSISGCIVLTINGRTVWADYRLTIDGAIPSNNDPKTVIVTISTGGNACCWATYLLDFTVPGATFNKHEVPALVRYGEKPSVDLFDEGFTYQNIARNRTGPLGEPLLSVYRYKWGSNTVETLRSQPLYNFTPIVKKKYPTEVFDDPIIRQPLVKVAGDSEFNKWRERITVASPMKRKGNLLIGQGCLPHSCGSEDGIFILDTSRKLAWGMYKSGSEMHTFGTLGPGDQEVRSELNAWEWVEKHDVVKRPVTQVTPSVIPVVTSGRSEIALIKDNGVLKVPATLNGLIPVAFIVDSGASDVCVPADVVAIMLRTGTLTTMDFTGTTVYRLADGSRVPSQTFRIRSLQIGDRVLTNVDASMSGSEGSLLLGQSFLSRFKRWSINNGNQKLELD